MDANLEVSIPAPEASDSSEVQAALQAASELWTQDPREALRWLRKAAEGAADAGDDLRSVKLARAAADLRSVANIQASFPPPGSNVPSGLAPNGSAASNGSVASAPAASAPVASAPTASSPGAEAPAAPPTFANNQNPAQTVPATPAAAAAAALQQASHAAQQAGPAGLANLNETVPTQQFVAAQQAAQHAAAQAAAAAQQAAVERAAAERAAVERAAAAAAEQAAALQAAAVEPAPISAPSGPSFVNHRAVRVALSPWPTGAGIFSVHPLAEGESPEPGWKEVLIVALDSAERLFPGRD